MDVICTYSDDDIAYKCFVNDINIPNPILIKDFVGEHAENKSNNDVISLSLISCGLKTFPKNLVKFFPKLVVIEIIACDISELSKEDLVNYKQLMYLGIVDCKLTQLPNDLFDYTPNIQFIDFSCNHINKIGPRIFDPLLNLRHANLANNKTVNTLFDEDSRIRLKDLKKIIRRDCRPLESLQDLAATKVTDSMNENNVAEVYYYSFRFGIVGLQKQAFMYMKNRMMPWLSVKMIDQQEMMIRMIGRKKWNMHC